MRFVVVIGLWNLTAFDDLVLAADSAGVIGASLFGAGGRFNDIFAKLMSRSGSVRNWFLSFADGAATGDRTRRSAGRRGFGDRFPRMRELLGYVSNEGVTAFGTLIGCAAVGRTSGGMGLDSDVIMSAPFGGMDRKCT